MDLVLNIMSWCLKEHPTGKARWWKWKACGFLVSGYFESQDSLVQLWKHYFLLLKLNSGTTKQYISSSGDSSGLESSSESARPKHIDQWQQPPWDTTGHFAVILGVKVKFSDSALPTSLAAGEPGCHPVEIHVPRALTQGLGCQDSPPPSRTAHTFTLPSYLTHMSGFEGL